MGSSGLVNRPVFPKADIITVKRRQVILPVGRMLLVMMVAARCGSRAGAFSGVARTRVARHPPTNLYRGISTQPLLMTPNDPSPHPSSRLEYEHGFHAGNFADVFKHTILITILQKMLHKNKPVTYVETHAGAGWYQYAIPENGDDQGDAQNEYERGIGSLLRATEHPDLVAHPAINTYLDIVRSVQREHGEKNQNAAASMVYPGSPLFASTILRQHSVRPGSGKDVHHSLVLYEKAKSQYKRLHQLFEHAPTTPSVTLHCQNGYVGLTRKVQTTNNPSGRALILIDPPYQYGSDTDQIMALAATLQRHWRAARLVIWHPVRRDEAGHFRRQRLYDGVRRTIDSRVDILAVEIFSPLAQDVGTGMLLIQPPFGIQEDLETVIHSLYQSLIRTGQSKSLKDVSTDTLDEEADNGDITNNTSPIQMHWL